MAANYGVGMVRKKNLLVRIVRAKYLYIMLFLPFLYYVIFRYIPMYGITIAFKDYNPIKGILGSPWVGLTHFIEFFQDIRMPLLFKNTLVIGTVSYLLSGWPFMIVALLLNEFKNGLYRKSILTALNVPYYLSLVIICGITVNILSSEGLVNNVLASLGLDKILFIARPEWFLFIYIVTGFWQSLGFSAIIYLAVLSSVSPELYEAACIEGAGRFRQMWHISIPHLMPMYALSMIMSIGSIIGPSFEKILLLYTPSTYEVADVISTYVYRRGLAGGEFSYGSAIGFFNSLLSVVLVLLSNAVVKRIDKDLSMI
jgi:putative aldouronate transport system permease protein